MVNAKASSSGQTTMCALLDTYGFALSGTTEDEVLGRERCLRRSTSQLAAWKRLLAQRPVRFAGRRVKEMVRRGIPPELRPEVWMALSGATALRDAHPMHYYTQLRRRCGDVEEPLDSATYRMFIGNLGAEGVTTVQRIFAAYRLHRDTNGAASSLAAVVAFLLVVMGPEREEDVFWLFLSFIDDKIYNKSSYKFEFWCRVQERVLGSLLRKKNPLLAEHIEKFASLQSICDGWFSSFFVMAFPSETLARIWDCVFCEGTKILHRIALMSLLRNQNTILSMSHSVNLPKILIYKLRRAFDAHEILTAAFRSVGSMSSSMIDGFGQRAERELRGEPPLPLNRSWKRRSCPRSK